MSEKNPYEDIIHLPHHVSDHHPQMPRAERAAQFSPFAALTGYDAAIRETARLTDPKAELEERELEELNENLRRLQDHIQDRPEVELTYFQPDTRKEGGAYRTIRGPVRRMNAYEQYIEMEDSTRIFFTDMVKIREI